MMPSRFAYQAGMIDELDRLATSGELPTDIVRLSCPCCRCSVYVPSDSDCELVECAWCSTQLATRQWISGVYLVEIEGQPVHRAPPSVTLVLGAPQ